MMVVVTDHCNMMISLGNVDSPVTPLSVTDCD